MIIGIGVDIVQVERIAKWRNTPGLLERFFHPDELSDMHSRGTGMEMSLAAHFAAKEAFGKALGTGLTGIVLQDIMVKSNNNGKPEIMVSGTAMKALENSGANKVHLSLAHEKDYAIAMVVLE